MTPRLIVDRVSVAYGEAPVVSDISLSLEEGAIGCLLGPSGCGKTSLLRAIAGFEPVAAGEIRLGGQVVSRPGETVPPEARNVGMVFQDFALFPHLSVADNIGFGLRSLDRTRRAERVQELLDLVGLEGYGHAYPHELSGGQQQRVALARAMAPRPSILLMDEPFSAIDPDLREQLATEIRAMLLRDGMTAILVTHDQMEAFAMADRIAVLGEGRLRQLDTAHALYHQPADRTVAGFIGLGVLLRGRVRDARHVETDLGVIEGDMPAGCAPGAAVDVLVRPDDVIHDDASPLRLPVVKKAFRGAAYLYTLRVSERAEVLCLVQSHHDHPVGESIGVRLDLEHVTVFAAE